MRREVNFGDAVDAARCVIADGVGQLRAVGQEGGVGAQPQGTLLLIVVPDDGDHVCAVPPGHLGGNRADAACRAVHQHVQAAYRSVREDGTVTGDPGDAEACALLGQVPG